LQQYIFINSSNGLFIHEIQMFILKDGSPSNHESTRGDRLKKTASQVTLGTPSPVTTAQNSLHRRRSACSHALPSSSSSCHLPNPIHMAPQLQINDVRLRHVLMELMASRRRVLTCPWLLLSAPVEAAEEVSPWTRFHGLVHRAHSVRSWRIGCAAAHDCNPVAHPRVYKSLV
jgi:hypothetical protein